MQLKLNFNNHSKDAEEFKSMWLKANRDGIQKKMAKHFKLSVSSITRIRKKLDLPTLHGGEHPGRLALIKRIKKLYFKERSSLQIAKIIRLNEQSVLNILHKENVKIRSCSVTNPLYFSVRSKKMTTAQALVRIKKLYFEGVALYKIAEIVGVDQGTVSNKLKAMGLNTKKRHNNRSLDGGYPCLWCGVIMDHVWQNKGIRKQKYCSSSCSNKAKDLRRIVRGQRTARKGLTLLEELKSNHKHKFDEFYQKIVSVNPIIKRCSS